MSTNEQRRSEAMKKLERELKTRDRQEKTKPLSVVAASLAVILVIVGGIWYLNTRDTGSESDDAASPAKSAVTTASSAAPTSKAETPKVLDGKRTKPLAETVSCTYDKSGSKAAKDVGLPPTDKVSAVGTANVTIQTNDGPIPLKLDRAAAPCTVNAITYLASKGFYNNTTCHRITTEGIKVLQCGDPSGTGAGGPGFQFANEYPSDEMKSVQVVYPRGSVAMANAGPGTNGSQFFLNYGDSPLRSDYTYFGTISDAGLKTLDAIAAKGTATGNGDGKPKETVTIETVSPTK